MWRTLMAGLMDRLEFDCTGEGDECVGRAERARKDFGFSVLLAAAMVEIDSHASFRVLLKGFSSSRGGHVFQKRKPAPAWARGLQAAKLFPLGITFPLRH